MLRKLMLVGVVAGASASVPVLYQSNPEAVEWFLGRGGAAEQPAEVPKVAMARPPAAEPRAETLAGRKVRLAADPRGHFNAEFRLNGRLVPALVDTGATLVAVNQSTARRIGIHLVSSDFTGTVETANGRAKAALARIERLEIGRIEVRDVDVVVLEDKALSGTLIGMSFLSRLKRFHVEGGALMLEQ